jgi:hypothetical protein
VAPDVESSYLTALLTELEVCPARIWLRKWTIVSLIVSIQDPALSDPS